MVKVIVVDTIKSFKISAKSDVIEVPPSYNSFSEEERHIIDDFCDVVHSQYLKVIEDIHNAGEEKSLCAIHVRRKAISNAVMIMEIKYKKDVFEPIYNNFIKTHPKKRESRDVFKPVKPKQFTKLDHIESVDREGETD
jgi:hypothetical protein